MTQIQQPNFDGVGYNDKQMAADSKPQRLRVNQWYRWVIQSLNYQPTKDKGNPMLVAKCAPLRNPNDVKSAHFKTVNQYINLVQNLTPEKRAKFEYGPDVKYTFEPWSFADWLQAIYDADEALQYPYWAQKTLVVQASPTAVREIGVATDDSVRAALNQKLEQMRGTANLALIERAKLLCKDETERKKVVGSVFYGQLVPDKNENFPKIKGISCSMPTGIVLADEKQFLE